MVNKHQRNGHTRTILTMLKLSIGNSISSGGTKAPVIVYDVDAQAYFTALTNVGVMLTVGEKSSVNNLFLRIKGLDPAFANFGNNGIYTAAKAIYPYVGNDLSGYRFNAISPLSATQSTDTAGYPTGNGYQYIAGGITTDGIYGAKGNGINGVILTNLNWISGWASALSPTSLCMGAVYKTTSITGRDDFGEYNPNVNMAGIWLRTKPAPISARLGCLETAVTGTAVVGGRGHWMLHRSGNTKLVYYQGTQQTYVGGQDRAGEGSALYGGQNTWTFLGLNFNYFNGVGAGASAAQRAGACVNFSANTLMMSYIMTPFSSALIPAWNSIVEAFCVETGKKTW